MEKKISLSEAVYAKLMYDYEIFEFKGSLNNFYCTIILNTYDYLDSDEVMRKYRDFLSGKSGRLKTNKIIESISGLKDYYAFQKELYNVSLELYRIENEPAKMSGPIKDIYVRETSRTNKRIECIVDGNDSGNAAECLRTLIMKYLSYPMYIREEILYWNTAEELKSNIQHKTKCIITTDTGSEFLFRLYKILPGLGEYHSYITGYASGSKKGKPELKSLETPMSIKLSSIKKITRKMENYDLSREEILKINNKISTGVEYISSDDCIFHVYFDSFGVNMYHRLYKDRPFCIQIEEKKYDYKGKTQTGGIYTFNSTLFQMENYLLPFGYHAKPLDNDDLYNHLMDFYTKSFTKFGK